MTTPLQTRPEPRAAAPVDDRLDDQLWPFAPWREGTRTRAEELESLSDWMLGTASNGASADPVKAQTLGPAIRRHVAAAKAAVLPGRRWRRRHTGARLERATSSLDAAEADLLQLAPPAFLLGQMPSVLNNVRRNLRPSDPRRIDVERIAKGLGVSDPSEPIASGQPEDVTFAERCLQVDAERARIVSSVRGAASAALREQNRVRSFRNVLVVATVGMAAVAAGLGILGVWNPTALPMCFAPEQAGRIQVVCPIQQSGPLPAPGQPGAPDGDIDNLVDQTVRKGDIFLVELVGLTAASVSAAGAMRKIRGSSEPYGVPIALAVLKLPTGAITAMLGLLLMRGGFVPGLSALDTSAQILAWAIVFGYAQQLFTRLVDQQAHTVLDGVRGGAANSVPAAA